MTTHSKGKVEFLDSIKKRELQLPKEPCDPVNATTVVVATVEDKPVVPKELLPTVISCGLCQNNDY